MTDPIPAPVAPAPAPVTPFTCNTMKELFIYMENVKSAKQVLPSNTVFIPAPIAVTAIAPFTCNTMKELVIYMENVKSAKQVLPPETVYPYPIDKHLGSKRKRSFSPIPLRPDQRNGMPAFKAFHQRPDKRKRNDKSGY